MSEPLLPQSPELRERDARLRALQRLAGRLAHDFNNYLSPIFGYLSLIKDETTEGSQAHEYAVSMERGVRRTTQLLESILLASRPERKFYPSTCAFEQLVDGRIKEWQAGLPPCSQIKIKTDLIPCQIYADEGLWREVVGQLLDNARFGLSHGGELQVTLGPKELSAKEATELGVQAAPGIELCFQDNGPGMSEETLLHAVDPFYSTRPKNLAIGIGLSIAYAVARLHGGQLVVKSREGEGVRVTIWIPCYPAGHSGPTTSTSSGLLTTQGNKVLLLEPDSIAMETATAVLQKAKFYVQAFPDAANALATFEKKPKNFVLAIINAHVAEPDGIEVARRLRARVPDLPLILICGNPQASQAAAQSGLVPPLVVLNRPFKTQVLLTEARKLVPAPESGSAPGA